MYEGLIKGREIKEYRVRVKLSQQKLADISGIPRFRISEIEQGLFKGATDHEYEVLTQLMKEQNGLSKVR